MRLEKISVSNYRNLDGVNVHFDLESNYIVGENNIGKSNLLALIHAVSNSRSFVESDYVDPTSPIVIELILKLNETQLCEAEDCASNDSTLHPHVKVLQKIGDASLQIFDVNTSEPLNLEYLRKLNFLQYDPGINASFLQDSSSFIKTASRNIYSRIKDLYKNELNSSETLVYNNKKGERILPLILAIDEPEIHMHPYMQRAILNSYKRILKNEDTGFLHLLKIHFDIDGLDGQLIIVTHSTDALVDNHRNIVRFYRKANGKIDAISGRDIDIGIDIEKHLLMHFPDIKEAFYAKCVLIVEGETEYGCIRGFSKTLNMPLDDYGICFVNAHGEGSILKLKQLFDHFKIPSVLIYDSDVRKGEHKEKNEFFTKEVCFEMDIVDKLIQMERFDLLRDITLELSDRADKRRLDEDFVRKPFKKIDYDINNYTPKTLDSLDLHKMEEYRAVYFAWLYVKKGILIGRIIGERLPEDCIPDCYTEAITRAREVAMS